MNPAIVVTGASSGIGRELARVAAREGAAMVLIGLSQANLDDLASELSAGGTQARAWSIDLSNRDAGQQIEGKLAEAGFYCDVLVNCAGFGVFGPAAETDPAQHLKLLDVNVRALTELTLRFLPGMLARKRGGVINVGSITSSAPGPRMSTYFASKAYVGSFSAALAAEVRGTGVTVTCLCPGVVRTAFFDRCRVGKTWLFKLAPRGNAPAIAEAGWRGFRAGKRLVVPRLIDRIIIAGAALLPKSVVLWLVTALMTPAGD
ncbi:MAG: SDR family oxidoreductase [Hyphomicrobiales bacterium]|nr:SDR family oxidoreductase [Hyphomicrobiales bacterium]MDE2374776.1 SDR family oxidoreductase [Hyphomicrobiales bacterium]